MRFISEIVIYPSLSFSSSFSPPLLPSLFSLSSSPFPILPLLFSLSFFSPPSEIVIYDYMKQS